MINFLIRRLVRAAGPEEGAEFRRACGRLSGALGLGVNLLLFAGKLLGSVMTGSVAIAADAFNNLSDAGSAVLTLVGFRLSGRRADREHPFGHGRMEYLMGLLVSVLILLVGLELGKASIEQLISPRPVAVSPLSAGILAAAAGLKLGLYFFNKKLAARIGSPMLGAVAADSLADALATTGVLASMLVSRLTGLQLDGWAGLAIACLIFRTGWKAARDTLDPLVGKGPDPELVKRIEETVLAHPEILSIHDLIIHDYGPGQTIMSLHAEISAEGDLMASHNLIDRIERELWEKFFIETSIHIDPVEGDDKTQDLRAQVTEMVKEIAPGLTIHDFRTAVTPRGTSLVFDVVVPFGCALSDREVEEEVRRRVAAMGGDYYAVLRLDHGNPED